ncbi:L,D-transpeptidase [Hydrogenophaga pseudoflava]|uniref:L,D-transpeptidase n=1 Tax=Hydrogenophaga pseudoflava TaxID=47421 RepID=UPI0027E3D0BB|nr:L,D-transpeptidase [Hydrogenophaga pseudoflava]MDQ7744408.1 L,D-transpeptidase [Hydrogenophaga pseudoflava]
MFPSVLSRLAAASLALPSLICGATAQAVPPSGPTQEVVRAIQARGIGGHGPFVVLDKVAARIWVFDEQARPVDSSPVLLGAARGDDSVPGIGARPIGAIRPHERTTPAGRFRLEPGRNHQGEDIFWVDYDAAVSLHRMRRSNPVERRPERMASETPDDNRISYGCINLPPAFYDAVVRPLFSSGRGWIYVLPETRPVQSLF